MPSTCVYRSCSAKCMAAAAVGTCLMAAWAGVCACEAVWEACRCLLAAFCAPLLPHAQSMTRGICNSACSCLGPWINRQAAAAHRNLQLACNSSRPTAEHGILSSSCAHLERHLGDMLCIHMQQHANSRGRVAVHAVGANGITLRAVDSSASRGRGRTSAHRRLCAAFYKLPSLCDSQSCGHAGHSMGCCA